MLTKIHDVPSYEPLRKIKNEMKTNASTVQCDLGGGSNGHLGLVLSAVEYATVSATPYVQPIHPSTVIPVGTTNWETQILREEHKKIHLFREANAVEKALLKQLTRALPDLYLLPYRDQTTNTISTPLVDILQQLFQTYGSISDEELE